MTLNEAIRVNTVLREAPVLKEDPIVVAALNLNIEALKDLQYFDKIRGSSARKLLPGETRDEGVEGNGK